MGRLDDLHALGMIDEAIYRMKVLSSRLTWLLGTEPCSAFHATFLVLPAIGKPCLFAQASLRHRSKQQTNLSIDSSPVYLVCWNLFAPLAASTVCPS